VRGIAPSYEQKTFSTGEKNGALRLVAAPGGEQGAVHINADARMYAGCFDGGQTATLDLDPARKAYVQILRGTLSANGQALGQGDALLMQGENRLLVDQAQAAEVLVFDLAA
jgi:redox-sensitive bicupin YhaK (pirin superfamily)